MRAGDFLRGAQALPFATIDTVAPGASLILAPHPDDESLGCGGLIASLCKAGRPPLIVAVTDGAGSHPRHPAAQLRALREAEMLAAASILGVAKERVHFLGLPDTAAPREGPDFERAAERIAALARTHRMATIFATWPHDPHGDHQAVAAIGLAAARLSGVRIRLYPVWGWLLPPGETIDADSPAGVRLDIGALLPLKRQAIAAHASQYSALIADDPASFRLPADLLAACDRPFEIFLDP